MCVGGCLTVWQRIDALTAEKTGTTASLRAEVDKVTGERDALSASARDLEASVAKMGIKIKWTSGLRTEAEQAALYAQGRTAPGKIVTYASSAKTSPHGRGAALDFAVLTREGVPTWDPPYWHVYEVVGRLAEAEGLAWGGRFLRMDMPHVQLADWKAYPEQWP